MTNIDTLSREEVLALQKQIDAKKIEDHDRVWLENQARELLNENPVEWDQYRLVQTLRMALSRRITELEVTRKSSTTGSTEAGSVSEGIGAGPSISSSMPPPRDKQGVSFSSGYQREKKKHTVLLPAFAAICCLLLLGVVLWKWKDISSDTQQIWRQVACGEVRPVIEPATRQNVQKLQKLVEDDFSALKKSSAENRTFLQEIKTQLQEHRRGTPSVEQVRALTVEVGKLTKQRDELQTELRRLQQLVQQHEAAEKKRAVRKRAAPPRNR